MIDVLLATYRPNADWLEAQVASIRAQRGVEVNLICREDVTGEGACANFAALLQASTAEYVAFADQDDVWLPDKLAKCLAKMRELEQRWGADMPLLVFSDARVVDASLKPLAESLFLRTRVDPLKNLPRQLVFQNTAYGNTMLINAALRRKALPVPSQAVMHDHWLMLVVSVFGRIAYLDEPLLLYRQHRNLFGGPQVDARYYFRLIRKGRQAIVNGLRRKIVQAEAFVARYGVEKSGPLGALVGFTGKPKAVRVWTLFRHAFFKQGLLRNFGLIAFA